MEGYTETAHLGMNTVMTHRAFGKFAEKALQAVRGEAARLEKLLSRFVPGSEISRINCAAGTGCVRVSDETYQLLQRTIGFSRICQGLFDITIGPLVDLWNIGRETGESPEKAMLRQLLPLVNYATLHLDPRDRTVGLSRPGQSIDLGGIGKGYASARILDVFRRYGVRSAFTNLGGNVAALSCKPDGSPWQVGIRHPREKDRLIGAVSVEDQTVVTSGDDQRFFIDRNGIRRHHILDPATGYPADSGLASVTVVAHDATLADALSTILFVAGREKGIGLMGQFPGAEAVFVDDHNRVYVTDGLKDHFHGNNGMNIQFIRKEETLK